MVAEVSPAAPPRVSPSNVNTPTGQAGATPPSAIAPAPAVPEPPSIPVGPPDAGTPEALREYFSSGPECPPGAFTYTEYI